MSIFDSIGTALANPIQLQGGSATITKGVRTVRESILDIIGTNKGETFFNEDYGCRLQETLFLPNDTVTYSLIKQMVIEAIETWEKRAVIENVQVVSSENSEVKCNILITFSIINTNLTDSFIYPFYEKLN